MPPISPPFLLLLLLLLLLTFLCAATASDDIITDLQTLRSSSPSGVIHLNTTSLTHFLTSPPPTRPYSLIIILYAAFISNKPDLDIPKLRSDFASISASIAARQPSSPIFFCAIDFHDITPLLLSSLNATSLPSVVHVSPTGSTEFNSTSTELSNFVESETGLTVGPIPTYMNIKLAITVIIVTSLAVYFKVFTDHRFWIAGAISVYMFSVSGLMSNVMRKTPMYITRRGDPTLMFFVLPAANKQLGGEGFGVGFVTTMVGVVVAAVTRGAVRMRSATAKRMVMVCAMVVCYWAVVEVSDLNYAKTGKRGHAFFKLPFRRA